MRPLKPINDFTVLVMTGALAFSSCARSPALSDGAACLVQAPRPNDVRVSRRARKLVRGKGSLVGTVFDGKQAVDQALISLGALGDSGHVGRVTGYSNSLGRFRLAHVEPGFYDLEVLASGYKEFSRKRIYIQRGRELSLSVCVGR